MAIEIERLEDGRARMTLTDEDAEYHDYLKALTLAGGFTRSWHPLRDSLRIYEWLAELGPEYGLAALLFGSDDELLEMHKYPERPAVKMQ